MRAPLVALAVALGVAACTPLAPAMHPTRAVVQVRNVVRIALVEINNDVLAFKVWNDGTQPLSIERDDIFLDTDHGPRKRRHADGAQIDTVAPGTARDVNLRFDWTGLRGTTVRVRFDRAISAAGTLVDVSAVEIRVL